MLQQLGGYRDGGSWDSEALRPPLCAAARPAGQEPVGPRLHIRAGRAFVLDKTTDTIQTVTGLRSPIR